MNHHNVRRGLEVRRILLAIIREVAARDQPIPCNTVIAPAVGIDESQVCRHMARLRAEGAFLPRRDGRRVYVEEMRP